MSTRPAWRPLLFAEAASAIGDAWLDGMELAREQSATWERLHGHCSVCGPGDCMGVAVLGLHCEFCKTVIRPEDGAQRETTRDDPGTVALVFTCPTCNDAGCRPTFTYTRGE